jgi:hypothetical protein
MDVEGFEEFVLLGGKKTLTISGFPPLLVEIWPQCRERTFQVLDDIGYDHFDPICDNDYVITRTSSSV